MNSKINNKELLTTPDAAKYLMVSASYLIRMRYEDKGPIYLKKGKFVFYTQEHLDAYLDANVRFIVPTNNKTKHVKLSKNLNDKGEETNE